MCSGPQLSRAHVSSVVSVFQKPETAQRAEEAPCSMLVVSSPSPISAQRHLPSDTTALAISYLKINQDGLVKAALVNE